MRLRGYRVVIDGKILFFYIEMWFGVLIYCFAGVD